MRKKLIILNLLGLLLSINQIGAHAKTDVEIPVEVIAVNDLGISDRDETKSVIEIRWRAEKSQKIARFNVALSVTYADGAIVAERRRFDANVSAALIEVSSVKTVAGKRAAFIKKIDARVFAVISKN